MKYITFLLLLGISACEGYVRFEEKYMEYYDLKTKKQFLQGLQLFKKNEFKKADSIFTVVIKNSRSLPDTMLVSLNPYYFRGVARIELGDFQNAINDLEHVSHDTAVLSLKADCFRVLQKYDTAISMYTRALEFKEDSVYLLRNRGICYYQKKDTPMACNDFRLAKLVAPQDTSVNALMKYCRKLG